mmetsp:Transcript_35081/g.112757  ORF Transcript_35081/g.112757 Transcript_35081/m.112757 type:complete len:117 (+) Transcript_35081:395-745(+)
MRLETFQTMDIGRIAEAAAKMLAVNEVEPAGPGGWRGTMRRELSKFLFLVVCADVGLFMLLGGTDERGEEISLGMAWTTQNLDALKAAMATAEFEPPLEWPDLSSDTRGRLRAGTL